MKFYREGARRILAGQKKMSTILITLRVESRALLVRKMLTAKRMAEKACYARLSAALVCGKAEDGSG
jgi:hypothetical protein